MHIGASGWSFSFAIEHFSGEVDLSFASHEDNEGQE